MGTNSPAPPVTAQVSVVVIGYDDAEHIADAVLSALGQGPAVAEVIAVDDASTDGTAAVLDRLAARHPLLRVRHRPVNSGGCGSPRNDGLRLATAPYVMFLDSDDVLPPGAVDTLLSAALRHDAPVAAGASVRRELPQGREVRWQRALYLREEAHDGPERLARLVRDTLCVNKLYARSFLTAHGITFPEGPFRYEDFVFTARVLAAAPRVAVVPDTVYVWHVRRSAARPSISLARDGTDNWRDRLTAHRLAVETFEEAGKKPLVHAARVKFLDHDLRMYVRELAGRGARQRAEWWRLTRAYLEGFDPAELRAARAPARWIARVIAASEEPRDLARLTALANRPARLLPPYARVAGRPVWDTDLPEVVLDQLDGKPLRRLPVTVDGEPRPAGGGRPLLRLRVSVHELYGRLAAAGPLTVDVEVRHRDDGRLVLTRDAALGAESRDGRGEVLLWTAEVLLDLGAPTAAHPYAAAPSGARPSPAHPYSGSPGPRTAVPGGAAIGGSGLGVGSDGAEADGAAGTSGADGRGRAGPDIWDVRVRVHCADGSSLYTAVRPLGPGLRRTALPDRRHGLLLVQPYATARGSLALRVAAGPRPSAAVLTRRITRALKRRTG